MTGPPPPSYPAARLVKTVDLAALWHNAAVLRRAARGRRVMAVVKGDAYGLGAYEIGRALLAAGIDALAVDTLAEGADLRERGIGGTILVMDVDTEENAAAYVEHGLTASVATPEQVRRHAKAAGRRPTPVWLRTNVGFNRFGPRAEGGYLRVLDALADEPALRATGVFAHLSSSADDPDETDAQARAFQRRAEAARRVLGPDCRRSLAATHGLAHPNALAHTEWVRPGLGLYGLAAASARTLPGWAGSGLDDLRPAVTVEARILEIVDAPGGEGVGYDRATTPPAGTRLASTAIGFARGLAGAGPELTAYLHGRACPLVGRPGMDCTQFDVTAVPDARAGEWMTLIGPAKPAAATARELGRSLYELLATLTMPVRLSDPRADPAGSAALTIPAHPPEPEQEGTKHA